MLNLFTKMGVCLKIKSVLLLLLVFSAVTMYADAQLAFRKPKTIESFFRRPKPSYERGDITRKVMAPILALSTVLELNYL